MKPLGIAVIGAGVLLSVCAVRNIDPRGVLFSLLTGDDMPAPGSGLTSFQTPAGRAKPYARAGAGVKGVVGGTVAAAAGEVW